MARALDSAIGLPSISTSALRMLVVLMPAEVSRSFMLVSFPIYSSDVRHRRGLAGGIGGMTGGTAQLSGGCHGETGSHAGLRHRDLAAHPCPRLRDRPARPRVRRLRRLE